ncbi:hypothetical protein CTHBC1_1901 [Acetivibrio thermocellus BC1]|jgi:hypothetical protein|uniref:hypothetical protein n=1 Tax=Acetivibrio thermocellus TaxID=1515 RepID=UPI0003B81F25|nr:hypothetical protein [Acetivibrio thermocellus]THJ78716.1 hypothetical protein EPD62_04620 [Acetivibrio thermocellus]CDG36513.1 hypothetical protein CTHBC1_1901 [Acetivibrio thermocellus BC1]
MSTEKDSMLRVRLTHKQSDALDSIIAELQAQIPEASVTTSSIARYALEKYVSDYIAKRDGTKIFIEIGTADATDEDIKNLYNLVSKMLDDAKENYSQSVHYMVGEIFEPIMMRMASLMKPKKPEVK